MELVLHPMDIFTEICRIFWQIKKNACQFLLQQEMKQTGQNVQGLSPRDSSNHLVWAVKSSTCNSVST